MSSAGDQVGVEAVLDFGLLFKHAPDAVFLMDPNAPDDVWIIVECNDAACSMNGYSRDELIGQDIHMLSPAPFDPGGRRGYLQRLRGQGTVRSAGLHRRKDGTIFPVEFSTVVLQIDGHELLLGIDRNITERMRTSEELQQAYAELEARVEQRTVQLSDANARLQATIANLRRVQSDVRRSEERYRSLLLVSTDIIWTAAPDGQIEDSAAWSTFTGQAAAEARGWGWLEAVHPEDREAIRAAWINTLQTHAMYQVEYRVRRGDGVYRVLSVRAVAVLEIDGSVREWVGACSDITAQKEDEQRQQLLSEASAVLGASLDYAATLTSVANLAVPGFADWCAVDILGPDDQLQRLAIANTDPAKVQRAWKLDHRYPATSVAYIGPAAVVRTNRSELVPEIPDEMLRSAARDRRHLAVLRRLRIASYISVPLRARGRTLGAVTFLATAASRRYTQADLRVAEELARRAGMAVDNAMLYQASLDAVRAREDFLGVAAHELKTPLTALLGYTQLLQARSAGNNSLDEHNQLAVRVIHDQAERLHRRIESLLDISRLQAGQFEIEPNMMDLVALCRRNVEQIQPSLEQHSVAFQCEDEALLIWGDEARLDEVVSNLIQNALKFSPKGGPVQVALEREGSLVRLSVTDRGIGVPSDVQSQVFERFYRAWNVNPVQISGMGIGLYVVKEIVTRHGGTVMVESAEGQGSTFVVRLPLLPGAAR
jgi:PAS domain S-box-containing protein